MRFVTPPGGPGLASPELSTSLGERMSSTEITTLLGPGSRFEGRLVFEGVVRIEGELRGEVKSDDVLVVAEGGAVHADVEVGTCIVQGGAVFGNIRAHKAIEIRAPSQVVGNLQAPQISIEKGVQFEGQCQIG